MANLTISIPDELKEQMDKQFPEANWSQISRNAIQQYIAARQNVVPKLEIFLQQTIQDINFEIGPGIWTQVRIENRMPIELVVDRILFTTTLYSSNKFIAGREGAHLAPVYLLPNGSGSAQYFFAMEPAFLVKSSEDIKQSVQLRETVRAYVQGFQQPVGAQLQSKIPLDEWQTYITNVKATFGIKEAPGKG